MVARRVAAREQHNAAHLTSLDRMVTKRAEHGPAWTGSCLEHRGGYLAEEKKNPVPAVIFFITSLKLYSGVVRCTCVQGETSPPRYPPTEHPCVCSSRWKIDLEIWTSKAPLQRIKVYINYVNSSAVCERWCNEVA